MHPHQSCLSFADDVVPLQPAVREYALSRALQLDPKCVPAWVALAELYIGWCCGWALCSELAWLAWGSGIMSHRLILR